MIRSTIDIKNSNLWENANQKTSPILNTAKRTIIVIGDNKTGNIQLILGKTSFIKLLRGDYDLQTKPSYFIEYFTLKRQGVQIEIYEISSFKFLQTLQFLITLQNCAQLMIVLCIDLTASQNFVNKINAQIQKIKKQCKEIIDFKNIHQIKSYNQQRSRDYHFIEQNEDIEIIDRMPFKFTIVGCKHDLFEKMKAEQKKWICRCLRYLAHINESNLIFCSTKNMQTGAQLRSVLIDQILGIRNKTYSNQKDHNKAIFIMTGEDKISEMSLPAFNNSGAFNEIKILQQQLESVFPSIKNIQAPQQENVELSSTGLDLLLKKCTKEISDLLKRKNIHIDRFNTTSCFLKGNNFQNVNKEDGSNVKEKEDSSLRLNFKKQNEKYSHQIQNYMDEDEDEN